jgi:phosphate:Na+ symporter
MHNLLNLLAAIALLVWGTHTVRTGILRVLGASLRDVLAGSVKKPFWAFISGVGVSSLLQSSTATCLIVSSFVGQGIFLTSTALIMMLGADVGTSLMALLFSFDLSWLSPLLIVVGVIVFVANQNNTWGRWGRVAIGLGLMTLALHLIVEATRPITQSNGMHVLLSVLPNDPVILILIGALLTVISYSSLAMVLLTATLCQTQVVSLPMALGLVLGANLGSGLLAFLTMSQSPSVVRRVPMGNLMFKATGCALAVPLLNFYIPAANDIQTLGFDAVVTFHFLFNVLLAVTMFFFTGKLGAWLSAYLPAAEVDHNKVRPKYLDPTALSTPSLAIACAAREALHQADVVEAMLRGIVPVIQNDDAELAAKLRHMDDGVDDLYSAIKFYLTQISLGRHHVFCDQHGASGRHHRARAARH